MPRRNRNAARNNLNGYHARGRQPGLGALHSPEFDNPKNAGDPLLFFASDFKRLVTEALGTDEKVIELGRHIPSDGDYDPIILAPDTDSNGKKLAQPVKFYDPEFMKLKILERRLSTGYNKQYRLHWTKNDIGRIKGEIRNELDRLQFPRQNIPVKFTNITRIGDADKTGLGRKLALIPEAESTEAELFCREHEICVNGLGRRLELFRYPYDEYVPKLSFARIERHESEETIKEVVGLARQLLPITVEMAPIEFYAHQTVRL